MRLDRDLKGETTEWNRPEGVVISKVLIDRFPYIHFDVWGHLSDLDGKLVFGVPLNHKQGMSFYVFSDSEVYKKSIDQSTSRECPICGSELLYTKLFKFGGGRK